MVHTINLQRCILNKYRVKVPVHLNVCKEDSLCDDCVKCKRKYHKHASFPVAWRNATSDMTIGNEDHVAILTGKINDLFVIDIDSTEAKQFFVSNVGDFEKDDMGCQVVKTHKGYHLYFKYPENLDQNELYLKSSTNVLSKIMKGIDIRGDKGIVYFGKNYICGKFTDEPKEVPQAFITLLKQNVEEKHEKDKQEYLQNNNGKYVKTYEDHKIQEIANTLNTLSIDRAENYDDWFKVGMCLKNDLGDEGLELFQAFSKRSRLHHLTDEQIERYYNNFYPKDLHIGTIRYMWRQDNPDTKFPKVNKKTEAEVVDDDEASKILCELAKDTLVYCSVEKLFYVFDETTGLWNNDEASLKRLINKYKEQLNFGSKCNYGGMYSKFKAMREYLTNHAQCHDGFIEQNIESSLRKILFKNGIYDMKTGVFKEGFDKNIVFVDRINRNYKKPNPQLVKEIEKIVFYDAFAEEKEVNAKFLKQAIAVGIAGEYVLKKGLWAVGGTNTAKGLITSVLISSFGSYIGSFNQNSLLLNKNTADEAKKMSWIFELTNKRIVIGNEVKKDKYARTDGNLVKSIISGGDNLQVRKNFKDETNKKNRAMFFLLMNDLVPFEPFDEAINDRILFTQFTRSFVDEPEDDEFEGKKDIHLKAKFNCNDDFKDAFVSIIFDAYQDYLKNGLVYPRVLKDLKKEWIQNESELQKAFDEYYSLTGNDDDFITVKDMVETLLSCSGLSKKKLELELNQIVKTSKKRVDGISIRVKRGVKQI